MPRGGPRPCRRGWRARRTPRRSVVASWGWFVTARTGGLVHRRRRSGRMCFMPELVHLDVTAMEDGALATVTLDSPHNRNALSRQLVTELLGHLRVAAVDPAVKVVLVRSSERVFCSGADLSEATAEGMEEGARRIVE